MYKQVMQFIPMRHMAVKILTNITLTLQTFILYIGFCVSKQWHEGRQK